MVRQTTELEVNMNSVERMVEYTAYAPEAPAIVEARRPLPTWPQQVRPRGKQPCAPNKSVLLRAAGWLGLGCGTMPLCLVAPPPAFTMVQGPQIT